MMGTHCLLYYCTLSALGEAAQQIKASAHFTVGMSEASPRDTAREPNPTTSSGCGEPALLFQVLRATQMFHWPGEPRNTDGERGRQHEGVRQTLPCKHRGFLPWQVLPGSTSTHLPSFSEVESSESVWCQGGIREMGTRSVGWHQEVGAKRRVGSPVFVLEAVRLVQGRVGSQ